MSGIVPGIGKSYGNACGQIPDSFCVFFCLELSFFSSLHHWFPVSVTKQILIFSERPSLITESKRDGSAPHLLIPVTLSYTLHHSYHALRSSSSIFSFVQLFSVSNQNVSSMTAETVFVLLEAPFPAPSAVPGTLQTLNEGVLTD